MKTLLTISIAMHAKLQFSRNAIKILFCLDAMMTFCVYLGKEFRFLQILHHKYTEKIHQCWCSLNLGGSRQGIENIHLFLEIYNRYMPLNFYKHS